jgi:hypothetical protein
MAFATVGDVTVRWGRIPTPEEAAAIEVRLGDVERMIVRRIPDLDEQVASGAIGLDDLIQVEADSVLRLQRNPDGFVSETDGNYTYQLSQQQSAGRLEILPEEWELLGVVRTRLSFLTPYPVLDGSSGVG